jgi:hypothetical protein
MNVIKYKRDSFAIAFIVVVFFVLSFSDLCTAEFIKTRPDVFQTNDGRGKVIVSRAERGVFLAFGSPVDIQLFEPDQLLSEGTQHVFISYDSSLNGYTKLSFGEQRSYRIIGSLTFLIGNFRVAIDNNHGYCSIAEIDGAGANLGILGFRGVEPVARYKGAAAQALLEANQLDAYQKVIKNFEYKGKVLTLNGTSIESASIGVSFDPPNNPCIPGKEKVFLNPLEVDKIRKIINAKERLKFLENILKIQRRSPPLDKLILIRISEQNAIGIDFERGLVSVIKPFSVSKENQICVMEDVAL